ncbi:MAG: hypothetical protein ACFNLP_04675, partial [Segatella oulorum]
AHPSFIPHTQRVYFWYGNAAARTFGRAHRHRPYAFRLGRLCVGQLISFGWIARGMGGVAWADCE